MVARVSLGVDATLPNPLFNDFNSILVEIWFARTNQVPTVDAGPDQTTTFGETVVLRGNAADPDQGSRGALGWGLLQPTTGSGLTVLWTQKANTAGATVEIHGVDMLTASFTAPSQITTLPFEFCASDGIDNSCDMTTVFVREPPPMVDLSIAKSGSPNPVVAGQDLVYTISITNSGPDDATGVTLTDTLPPGVSFVSAASTQGSCGESGGTVTCDLGIVANGLTSTVTIVVTPLAAGTLPNAASVTANETDSNAANDQDTEDTKVLAPIPTLSRWGLILLSVVLLGTGVYCLRRRGVLI